MTAMLNVKDLRAYYGQVQALHGLSFSLNEGSLTTLLGANGAGKTTTLRAICNMVRSTGAIEFEGKPLSGRSTENVVRLGIAHVPQGRGTFTTMTVEENLRLGAYVVHDRAKRAAALERVYSYFPILREKRNQLSGTLSGGQLQMVCIGRGLMSSPKMIMLDEPSAALAPQIVMDIFRTIHRITRDGMTVLMVEQNFRFASTIADRHYIVEQGRVVDTFRNAELAQHLDRLHEYLGV